MTTHPADTELALLASGDCGFPARLSLYRHVRGCEACERRVAEFAELRAGLRTASDELPADLDWDRLAVEMRANIRLGLAAGECVRREPQAGRWNPKVAVAFASLVLVIVANFALRPRAAVHNQSSSPVLESTGSGLEVRTGASSFTLLNRQGAVADQTVNAQGAIRARYIDSDTGAVTINNVYLE